MGRIFLHNHRDFSTLLKIIGADLEILPALVEKDYWLMHVNEAFLLSDSALRANFAARYAKTASLYYMGKLHLRNYWILFKGICKDFRLALPKNFDNGICNATFH